MSLFSNQSVPIDALPTSEEEFEGLPLQYRTLRAAVYAGVMLLLFAAMGTLGLNGKRRAPSGGGCGSH